MKDISSYRELCNKLGKGKLWSMNIDEICDYIDENYIFYSRTEFKSSLGLNKKGTKR